MSNRSRSPSPSRSPNKKNPGGTMEKTLPVYSDFSHMTAAQGIGNIRFAVSLREENPDEIVARVFPLTKIIPGSPKEKKPKPKPKKIEEKLCSRPDCAARKDHLNVLKDENKGLKNKLQLLENRLETSKNKIALTEKSIILAEEKNDNLNGQIEEAQNKIISIQKDVDKAESFNATLRKQLQTIQDEIESIKQQTNEQNNQLQDLLEDKSERKIIFAKHLHHHSSNNNDPEQELMMKEVSVLRFSPDDGEDSDD